MRSARTGVDYNRRAGSYARVRRLNRPLLQLFATELAGCERLLSLGSGQGRYEAELARDRSVVGLDLSLGMLLAGPPRPASRVNADMMRLPLRSGSFDGVMVMQSLHHVGGNLEIAAGARQRARLAAINEISRVVTDGPLIIVITAPRQAELVWFWKYFPEALERKLVLQPSVGELESWLERAGFSAIRSLPFHDTMVEGFYDPAAPLSPVFRDSFSEFGYLTSSEIEAGVERLAEALEDGGAASAVRQSELAFDALGGNVTVVLSEKR